jgi:hypothetical protein
MKKIGYSCPWANPFQWIMDRYYLPFHCKGFFYA